MNKLNAQVFVSKCIFLGLVEILKVKGQEKDEMSFQHAQPENKEVLQRMIEHNQKLRDARE